MTTAIVNVRVSDVKSGKAEIKIYHTSENKKKGVTIEARKLPDFEYIFVEKLEEILMDLLEKLIAGEKLDNLVMNPLNKTVGKTSVTENVFNCNVCSWKTRFKSALKTHMTKFHEQGNPRSKEKIIKKKLCMCDVCGFHADDSARLITHLEMNHEPKKII